MAGTLYVVATPIGNLEDITLRALRVLRDVALIAAEDTRRTAKLLQQYSISTPTTSLHEHNERSRTPALLERLAGGESIALVSDAGTPLISDPGAHLVREARAAGIRVEPVPGPSAVMAALSSSGFPTDEFAFAGFPPARGARRNEWFNTVAQGRRTTVIYEAPHRIQQTLEELCRYLGDKPIFVAREMTKLHETSAVRPITEHLSGLVAKGEFVIVLPKAEEEATQGQKAPVSGEALRAEFGHLTATQGLAPRAAIKKLATKYGLPSRQVYAIVHSQRAEVV